MPTTVKEIAEACKVSKATVRRKLDEMGFLADGHVTKEGQRHVVSDYAASAVASALSKSTPQIDPEGSLEKVEGMYERYIALLEADKTRLETQLADKDREISRLLEANAELTHELAEMAKKVAAGKKSFWQRLLPSGD